MLLNNLFPFLSSFLRKVMKTAVIYIVSDVLYENERRGNYGNSKSI